MSEAVDLQAVYRELLEIKERMVSKAELAGLLETMELIHNHKTMLQVQASEEDIRAGRTKPVRSVKDLLAEMEK
jgi:hypothetical protein